MVIGINSRDVTVYRQTILREKGMQPWVGYINLTDMDFTDSYSFPGNNDMWKFPDYAGMGDQSAILIEVPNTSEEHDSPEYLYFPLSLEEFRHLATARLVNETWQKYDVQEIIISKAFLNVNNIKLFFDTESGKVESTMMRRNNSRMRNVEEYHEEDLEEISEDIAR